MYSMLISIVTAWHTFIPFLGMGHIISCRSRAMKRDVHKSCNIRGTHPITACNNFSHKRGEPRQFKTVRYGLLNTGERDTPEPQKSMSPTFQALKNTSTEIFSQLLTVMQTECNAMPVRVSFFASLQKFAITSKALLLAAISYDQCRE